MLDLKVNKKMLQNYLSKKCGQVVLLKDLHNIGSSSKDSGLSGIEEAVEELKKIPGSVVEVIVTQDNVVHGIFFQDEEMRRMYDRFPEILFVDATYKLNDLRMPLYLFLVEDGNGESEVVATWMVVTEDAISIRQMANIFKKHNPKWSNTVTIMADKDFIERDAFKAEFPDASILICLFHVLRTFRREITCDKLGITSAERSLVLEIIQKIAFARTAVEYDELHQDLIGANLKSVSDYFNTNWHPIREQWVDGLKNENVTFQNRTNNRIESINQKLKSVITKYSSLPQFFSQLLIAVDSLRTERDHRALSVFQKVPVTPFKPDSPEYSYMQILTPYALGYVTKQLNLAQNIEILGQSGNVYEINSSEGIIRVTPTDCDCTFRKSMQLPCRHIFAVRSHCEANLYSSELCATRWTLAYYRSNHRVMAEPDSDFNDSSLNVSEAHVKTKPLLSQHDKYRKSFHVAQRLASVVSESPMREFNDRFATLNRLLRMWEQGDAVILSSANESASADEMSAGGTRGCGENIPKSSCGVNEGEGDHSGAQLKGGSLQESSSCSKDTLKDVSNLKLPPKQKKRGRPKGSELTAIGLPKKKRKGGGPVAFIKKHPKEKERIMLEWFVSSADIRKALAGELLGEELVETRPEKIPDCCTDENVNVYHIKKYFTSDAWQVVSQVIEIKRSQDTWCCRVCQKTFQDGTSICCDSCLDWFHLCCVGLKSSPKRKEWFCRFCCGKAGDSTM